MKRRVISGLLVLIALIGSAGRYVDAKPVPPCEAEPGHIVLTTIPSALYGKSVAVNVYLPPCYDPNRPTRYPVVYLLHGGGTDETQWPDLNVITASNTLISQGAASFVVVMPGGEYHDSIDYSAFVIHEVLPNIESQYPVQSTRSGRAIGGLSLGGYWALRIAFLHPDVFAAVGGYSPVITRGYPDDPLRLARRITVQDLQGLSIGLDVGKEDSLAYDTKQLARVLRARGLTVSLTIGHGGHARPYWRAHTYAYLGFFMDTLAPTQSGKARGL